MRFVAWVESWQLGGGELWDFQAKPIWLFQSRLPLLL